ncbi:phosphoglycerate kinase [Candidatus Microgenomates bacterium]|nr:phosphoglycerate kinase [Candidatus Microgenomates bacterium]
MAFTKQTIRDVDLAGKTVLVSVDYNVPVPQPGKELDDFRIRATLPTLEYLLKQNCKVILMSHRGRPAGEVDKNLSLEPVARLLKKLVDATVHFASDCVGPVAEAAAQTLKPKDVLLLENTRFHIEEENNDGSFAKELANLAEVFVQDAFGNAHRQHASIVGVPKFLPAVAGLLLEKEVSTITNAMANPKRPLVAIVGGAKVSGKIELLERLVDVADRILIGGAMANTFLKYFGYPIGKSVHEPGQEAEIKRILDKMDEKVGGDGQFGSVDELHDILDLPYEDVAVAKTIAKDQRRVVVNARQVSADEYILDIGPQTVKRFAEHIQTAQTIIWNGPVGMTEFEQFAEGSNWIADTIAKQSQATSIIGGGDTMAFVMSWSDEAEKRFDLISTGGGASLELMAGKRLPGVDALLDKRGEIE